MLKPLIPIVKDTLSHTFSEAIHIATVHAIYGSNHLQKELSGDAADNTTGKHNAAGTNEESNVPVHVSAHEFKFGMYDYTNAVCYAHLKLYKLKSGFIINFSPPPEFS